MYDTAQPYIACYLIIRQKGKMAFVLRKNTNWMNDHYGLPAGKVEKNESFSAGAAREGLEEVGITINPENLKFVHACHRFEDKMDWVDIYFEVLNYEGEVHNAEPHMHSEIAWLDPENFPDNLVPSGQFVLEQIKAGKLYSEYGWSN